MRNHRNQRFIAVAIIAAALLGIVAVDAAAGSAPFTVVLLPDTQNYAEKYPEAYLAQTQWIRDNARKENIRFVIHLGDIVQNPHIEDEWKVADAAHKVLDGRVPYSVVPGNHDQASKDGKLTWETPLFDKYFPPSRFARMRGYGAPMGDSNSSNYCTFKAGGLKFLVLSLVFAPNEAVLDWANGVLEAHPNHRVIVATHYYMRPNGRSTDEKPYGLDGYVGERLWNAFIRKHESIFLVVSGHVPAAHHQTALNDAGKTVHEILCDYQGEANGGDGWLLKLWFVPKRNRIFAEAYSPTLGQSRLNAPDSYVLEYTMRPAKSTRHKGGCPCHPTVGAAR
jgi:3',5'-cyclic AMP phosphodiesterase CpdA